jgi:hypothetical protein
VNARQYQFSVTMPAGITATNYTGGLAIRMCNDAAQVCASPVLGSPLTLPYMLQISAPQLSLRLFESGSSLRFTYRFGDTLPASKTLVVQSNTDWRVVSLPSWLRYVALSGPPGRNTGSGSGSGEVYLEPVTGLLPGTLNSEVVVETAAGLRAAMPVQLTVEPVPFVLSTDRLTFSAVNGQAIPAQGVLVTLDRNLTSATWTVRSTQPWLVVANANDGSPMAIGVAIDAQSTRLRSGVYEAALVFTAPGALTRTLAVTLNLATPTLSVSPASLIFGGIDGRSLDRRSITVSLTPGVAAAPMRLVSTPEFVLPTTGSSLGTHTSTSLELQSVFGPSGTRAGSVVVSASVNGDTITATVPVAITLEARKLLLSEIGVAFASTPEWQRLTRTVAIRDNFGRAGGWTAESDQPWLSVTRSGTLAASGTSVLSLVANPSLAALNTVSVARVTLRSNDASVTSPEQLVVGIWRSATARPSVVSSHGDGTYTSVATINTAYSHIAADPVRPFAYVSNGNPIIDVIHVYSGAVVRRIDTRLSRTSHLAVSQDGAQLFVANPGGPSISAFDLSNDRLVFTQVTPTNGADQPISHARPNGVSLLVTSIAAYSATTGTPIGIQAIGEGNLFLFAESAVVSASRDGKRLSGRGGFFDVDFAFGSMLINSTPAFFGALTGNDSAISRDGTVGYRSSGDFTNCRKTFLTPPYSSALIGVDFVGPNNIEVGSDGRIYCGIRRFQNEPDVSIYDEGERLLRTVRFTSDDRVLLPRTLTVSGDGLLMLGLTNDPKLVIIAVGP